MRRYISLGVVLTALCGLLAVMAGSASAFDLGIKCQETTKGTGRYLNNTCSEVSGTMTGNFLVEVAKEKTFKIKSGVSVLIAGGFLVECKKDTGTGKIINDTEGESKIKFEECAVEDKEKTKKCKIADIPTKQLLTVSGTIAVGEAKSEMGGFTKAKEGTFATIPPSAECKSPETAPEGSIVCEGAAQVKSVTGTIVCATTEVEKGVFVQTQKKIGVLVGNEVSNKEGSMKAFGGKATLKTEETITYGEPLTLFP
jgi:hypothetical protein